MAEKKIIFRSYLYSLSDGNGFGEMIIQENFPGLKEYINRWVVPTQEAMVSSVNDDLSGQVATKVSGKFSGYMAVKQFLDPNDPLFRIRMNSDLNHILQGSRP